MQTPQKHHFLPVFYLKQWANPDGRIVEFRKPYGPTVKPRRLHPEATGWMPRLYLAQEVHNDPAEDFETSFFSPVDSSAADALRKMLTDGTASKLTMKERHAWSNFFTSLLLRMPDDLGCIRSLLANGLGQFLNYAEAAIEERGIQHLVPDYKNLLGGLITQMAPSATVKFIIELITQPEFQTNISKMKWLIVNTEKANIELLTSDRPVTISDTLNQEHSNLGLPFGPRHLFVATHSDQMINLLKIAPLKHLVTKMNTEVVEGAASLICGRTDSQLPFVQKRMGTKSHNFILRRLPIFQPGSGVSLL